MSSINTEAIASLNPRARRSGLLWAQLAIVVIALIVPMLTALLPSDVASRVPLGPEKASAATSNQLNFQGRLLTNTGALVPDGVYNMEFNLYNVASGGSTLWTEDRLVTNTQGVSVQNGYYSVYLGQYDAFPAIDWSQDLYLGMTIRGTASCVWGSCTPADSEMTPRFKLTAVPYAFRASNVASSSTNAASSNSDGVSITTGNALGATSNSGNITVDVGTATGTTGTISLGSTNASALTIGRAGVTTTLQGSVSLTGSGTALSVTNDASIGGALTVNGNTTIGNATSDTLTVEANATFNGSLVVSTGDQFTNAGSTVFTALAISDVSGGGNIGSAASTVDVATTFNVNQTTAGQTLTLPTPTSATSGRMAFVNNVGSASFTMYGSVIATGKSNAFIWNGSAWVTTVSLSGSVVNTIGTIDSQTKSADGAVISSNAIYLQTADASFAGLVSTGTQTFAGAKTFNGLVTAAGGLTVSSGQNLTLSGVTSCVSLKTNGSGVVGCGANEFTYVVAASDSVNSATANYIGDGDTGGANDGDQVQINAAIAAADAAGGGMVFLLEGTYVIDDTILLENGVSLVGSGIGTVIRSAADGGVADNFNMIENSDQTGGNYSLEIKDLVIDGNNTNISASSRDSINFVKVGSGVGIGALTGFVIDNVHIINSQTYGIAIDDSRNSRLSNSVIRDNGSTNTISIDTSDRIQINDNRIVSGGGNGITMIAVTNSSITNNILDNVGASGDMGISISDASNYNLVDGNVIQDTNGVAIEIGGSTGNTNNTISNNTITGSSGQAIRLTLAFSTLVTGNNLFDNNAAAGATDASISIEGNADENSIINNFIQDTSGAQSYAINVSGSNADNNYLADNILLTTDGILDTGDNTTFASQLNADTDDLTADLVLQAPDTVSILSNTDITGTLTVSSTATFNGNTVIGNANTDTLTINAGTSGSGITLADSSFFNCAGLTTSASGVLTCSTTVYASTLQNAYDNDANGSDAIITLTSTDGAFILRDAASTVGTLFVVEANGGTDYFSVASTGTTVSTGLTVTSGNSLTLANNTSCVNLKTNSGGVVSCGANEHTYVVAATDSVNSAAANYVADGDGGSAGDGDQTEINSAITAANAAGGGTVLLLEGTYTIDASVLMLDNVILKGSGDGTVIRFAASYSPGVDDEAIENAGTVYDVEIRDLTIDVNDDAQTNDNLGGIAIVAGSGTDASSLRGVTIDNVSILDTKSYAINLNGADHSTVNNVFIDCNNGGASDISLDFASGTNIRLSNSRITDCGMLRIGGNNNTIVGNNISYSGYSHSTAGGAIVVNSDYNTITGNTITGSFGPGIFANDNVTITGNTIIGGNSYGIACISSGNITISNNLIRDNANDGINFNACSDVQIANNNIINNTGEGLYLTNSSSIANITITGNNFEANTDQGIEAWTGVHNLVISNNSFKQNATNALYLNGANDNIVQGNSFYDNGSTGSNSTLAVAGDTNSIIGNNFYDSQGTSIFINIVSGTGNYLADNYFDPSSTYGSAISDSGTSTVYANQLDGNSALRIGASTSAYLQNASNSTNALQIRNISGTALLNVDTSATSGTNLLINSGVESGTTNFAAKTGTTISQSSTYAYEGSHSLLAATTAAANGGANALYQLAASTQYTVSFYARLDSGTMSTAQIGYSTNGSTDTSCATGQTINTTWTRISCTFTTGGTVSGTRYVYLKQTDATARNIYIDAVQLEAAATASDYNLGSGKIYVSAPLTVNTLAVNSLGTSDTSTYLCRNSSNLIAGCTVSPLSSSLTDNITDAFDLQEGTNNYININTTNGSENISFGNATTNPSYSFLGSGTLTVTGDLAVNGGDITTASGDLTIAPNGGDTNITGNLDVSGGVVAGAANEFSAGSSGIDYFGNATGALRVGYQAGIPLFSINTLNGAGVNAEVAVGSSAASVGTPTKNSSTLSLYGSYYNGSVNFADYTFQTIVTGTTAADNYFALTNTANAEILTVDQSGNTTIEGDLSLSDGSSNYVTFNVNALAGDYDITIPTITANDTMCLLVLGNCAGAGREFTAVVGTSVDSSNVSAASYVADGTSDEDEINSAITAANTAGGGKVLLLEGTYTIDGTIDIKSDVELVGSGQGATIIRIANGTNANMFVISESTNPSNFTIRDLSIDANDTNNTGTQGGIAILTAGSDSGATSARGPLIENVEIHDLSDNGIYFDDVNYGTIADSHIYDGSTYGIWVDSSDVQRSVIIRNNNIHDITNNGVNINDAPGTVFSGNTVKNTGLSGLVIGSSNGATVADNYFYNATNAGIEMYGGQVSVTGNHINTADYGIYGQGIGWATYTGNDIGETTTAGMYFDEIYYSSVTGNTIYNSTGNGIELTTSFGTNPENTISGNNISNIDGKGILLVSTAQNNIVSGNNINSIGLEGIDTAGADYTQITDNYIYNFAAVTATSDGIAVTGDSDNNSIIGNRITDGGSGQAIDIGASANNTYLADNTYGTAGATSINDGGTNTIFANQLDSSGNIELQAGDSGVLEILSNTDITGTLTVVGTTNINTSGTAATSIGNSSASTTLTGSSILLNSATLQRTAAGTTTFDLIDSSNTVLSLTNSGAGVASLGVDGAIYFNNGANQSYITGTGAGAALRLEVSANAADPGFSTTGSRTNVVINDNNTITTRDVLTVEGGGTLSGNILVVEDASNNPFLTVNASGNFQTYANTVIGNANTDTLTINAGTSGSGITFADSSFFSCTALETDASGDLTCGTDADSGATLTLQGAYTNDADGSDAVIALTSADGAVILRDAASTIGNLFTVEANGGADYLSVASTGTTVTGPSGGSSTALTVNQGAASNVGLAINGASTASANFLQVTGFGESYSSLQVDNAGRTTIRPVTGGDGNALVIRNAAGTTTPFYVDTSTGYTYTYGQIVTGIVDITGATKYSVGGSNTSFTSPQGASISAKLAFDLYNPGGSNQLVALGLPSGANANARGISLFDNRAAGDNQAILSVFSPDESDVFGLSSDGSNAYGYLKATSGLGLGVKIGTTVAATFETSGNTTLGYDLTVQGGDATLGTTTQAGTLTVSDGSSNTVTLGTNPQTGNYTLSIPTLGANDTLCVVTVGNCAGAGREFTAVVGTSVDSSNISAAGYVADGNTGTAGDGDQVEINAAIDAVNAAGGGKVLLLEGTYTIDATIDIDDDVEIIGSGQGATIITIPNSLNTNTSFFSEDSNPDNWAIKDLTINMNSNGNQSSGNYTGIDVRNASSSAGRGGLIENVEIFDFTRSQDTAIYLLDTYNTTVRGNRIYNGEFAVYIEGDGSTPQNINVFDNYIQDMDSLGIYATDSVSLNISNNTVNSHDGVGTDNAAIELQGAEAVSITDNIIMYGTGYGIRAIGSVSDTTVKGNRIEHMTRHGIYGTFGYSDITNNDIWDTDTANADAATYGQIVITGAAYTTIANNNIAGSASSDVGIRFESDQGSPVDSVIANNVIGLHTTVGIYLETGSDRNIITGNSIYDNDTNGIFVTDSNNNLIQNNSLYDNGAATTSDGIAVAGNSDNNQIIGNRITDTAGTGQAIDLQASTVDNTYLADNTYSGTGALTINDSGTNTRYANQISAASVLQSNSMALTSNANTILTGSIDPTASTSVTGVSTLFTRELQVGDKITVSGQTRTVVTITSDTALTVDTAFSDNANDTSVDRIPVGLYVKTTDSSANALYIADSSNATVLSVSTANSGSANNSMVFRGIGVFGNSGEVDVAYNGGAEIRIGNNFYGDDYWTGGTGGFTYTFTPAAYTTGSASPFAGLTMTQNFAPTSGTNVYSAIASTPTINQTGTAAGITRGLYVNPTLTAFNDFRGIQVDATSSYATANNQQGAQITVTDTGAVASGTDTTLGASINLTRTGASGGTINNTGLNISLTGDTGGTSTNTGLNVSVTGADTNYAALFSGGNVGIGDSTPAALLTVGASDAFQVDNSGNVTAAGLLTANGGLTIQAGDTFTFNSDGFTDFTGGGLINNSGLLSVDDSTATGFFRNGGNSFSATATLGTNDANSLVLETNNQSAVTIASGGAVTLQNNTNSTAAFSVRTSLASTVLGVDTTTRNVCINCTTATAALSVNGVDDEVQLRVKADAAQTTTVFEVLNGSSVNLLSVAANGATTISDDLAIDGGDLTTTATTFNLLNSTATTVNAFGGATTALNLGTTTGTINLGSSATTNTQTFNIANGQVTTGATSVNILSGAAGTSGTATLSLGNSDRVTQIDIGNVAADAARTINLGTGSNTVGIDTLNIGTGATTVAGGKTINIGNGTPTGSGTNLISIGTIANASTLTLQGGTGSTAVSIQTGSGGTLSVGSSGVANTIQVGNTTGAVAQTINIGNNTTASSSTTLSMGSTIGTSPTLIQGGTSGVTVKPANGTTAFQVQNASSASLFTVDTTNNVLSLLGNNNGAPQAWQSNANTIPQHDNIANAVVYNGYIYVPGGDNSSSVYSTVAYARVNASGTIDTWSTTGTLSTAVTNTNAIEANGYLYVLGGSTNTASTNVQSIVQYAKINADGTLGTFTTTSSLPAGRKNGSVVTLNGYMYYIGGDSSATATPANTKTVYFAKINADGTLGTWANVSNANAGYLAGTGTYGQKAFTANGYIYVMGGNGTTSIYYARPGSSGDITSNFTQEATNSIPAGAGNSFGGVYYSNGYAYIAGGFNASVTQSTVYYAPLNANGSVGTWTQQNTANDLPLVRATFAYGQSNGYLYAIGGYNGSTSQTTVYYTSLQRIKAGGNLDLTAYSTGALTDPNGAGSLTAGNTLLIGTLQVQDAATFNDNVNINGNLSVGNGDLYFGSGANRTIGIAKRPDAGTGYNLTLQGGAAGSGNNNGGNLILSGAAGSGSGVKGLVVIDTATYSTATLQTSATSTTITQANVDTYGGVLLSATASGVTFTLPDPTQSTVGRVIYVTNAGSNDFTLAANTVGTALSITLKPSSTATMFWNGSDWTAAGASSSTDLQAAYNNTAASAGNAEIVLSNTGTGGLTVRNGTSTALITGGLFETQTSIGSNLFSVNNNATEYATNGGAETSGTSTCTSGFPASTWTTAPAGGTCSRSTATIATGTASAQVATTAANHGLANTLSTTLTSNLQYSVSFTIKSSVNFSALEVVYSRDGTNTSTTACASAQTVTQSVWTRISCSFTAPSSGITSSNAIFIRQTDGTARTINVDNLSVTVKASVNHAADGSVDAALGSNWTAVGGSITKVTSPVYDTSGAVSVTTGATDRGLYNNLTAGGIVPTQSATGVQYRAAFYIKANSGTVTLNSTTPSVYYSPNSNTTKLPCYDLSTTSIATTDGWKLVSCIFTTDNTSPTGARFYITNTANTSFYADALTITLNTNTANNVQIGGGSFGGPATLFTLDRSNGTPIADNNSAYLGSMYYDTSTGRIQCYEADGWGACGAAPDNYVNLNPEYAGAVLNGTGVGTMTADFCANQSGVLQVNYSASTDPCFTSGDVKNYYKWTSPQATQQTYSIYVTYQLPSTFNGFSSDDTVQLSARVDSTTNASVTYEMYAKTSTGSLAQCWDGVTSETNVITGGGGSANTWYSYGVNGNEATSCGLNSTYANGFIIFKINMKANSNASAYVSTLSFTTTGR